MRIRAEADERQMGPLLPPEHPSRYDSRAYSGSSPQEHNWFSVGGIENLRCFGYLEDGFLGQ